MMKKDQKYQAVIFDLDGTVLDNEQDWEDVFERVAEEEAVDTLLVMRQPNGWIHEPGVAIESNWKRILGPEATAEEVMELAQKVRVGYKNLLKTPETILMREGVDELVEEIANREKLTALCTGTTWNTVEAELEQIGLVLAFNVTTTGEEVQLPKPDPEIYVLTAQKLGVETRECIVLEDSIAGVRSAAEAGCVVVGLVSDYAPQSLLIASGAKYVVSEMAELMGLGLIR